MLLLALAMRGNLVGQLRKTDMATKLSPKQQTKVGKVMREFKEGTLHQGAGKKAPVVKNPKQAIAIALSEARKAKKK